MRAPYKYPYLSIFILGYYFLEHEGYYYKFRNYFGYDRNEVNYVIELTDESFDKMINAPGRKALVRFFDQPNDQQSQIFKKIARKYKEKMRSPLIFAEIFCGGNEKVCEKVKSPAVVYFNEGRTAGSSEIVDKKMVKKMIKDKNS